MTVIINNLKQELSKYKFDNTDVLKEIAVLFLELKDVSLGQHIFNQNTDSSAIVTVMLYQTANRKVKVDRTKIEKWLELKLKTKNIKLIKEL